MKYCSLIVLIAEKKDEAEAEKIRLKYRKAETKTNIRTEAV
jgi:hypothetical protein